MRHLIELPLSPRTNETSVDPTRLVFRHRLSRSGEREDSQSQPLWPRPDELEMADIAVQGAAFR
jgi:hypothetical protein